MRPIDADDLDNIVLQLNKEGRAITRNEYKMIDNIFFEFPTIEAEPVRRGRWIIEPGIGCWCSACGFDIGNELDFMEYVNYCPNCGARMEEEG